jgi:hypothetical protein
MTRNPAVRRRAARSAPRRALDRSPSLVGAVLIAVSIGAAAGCRSGWDYRSTLDQLYQTDENGRLYHASTIKELSFFPRALRSVLGPFGLYDPAPVEVPVTDPSTVGRETLLALSHSLDGDPALTAFAVPHFCDLALRAPFELTRAQAVGAIRTALDRQLPRLAPLTNPVEENSEEISEAVRELIGVESAGAKEVGTAATPSEERTRVLVQRLATTDYRTPENTRTALKALGLVHRLGAGDPRPVEEGIYRLSRRLCRLTLLRLVESEKSVVVRGNTAEALRVTGAGWAERALLDMLRTENDPAVIRKVYRSLADYRTPAVARAMLEVFRSRPGSLDATLAKRGLLEFTREDLGRAPEPWEKRLAELGYLESPDRARPVR